MDADTLPVIIQGGMGIGVSSWPLARAVAQQGQLGVVSGTALDNLLIRRLQDGDIGGNVRRAMEAFPYPAVASETLRRFFKPEGRSDGEPYALLPMYRQVVDSARNQLTILANFVEVWLAKEGHDGKVGINFLSKVQMPTLPSLYGAMLAGVDYVLMGAGIPREIPGALDSLSNHEASSIRLDIQGPSDEKEERLQFDPREFIEGLLPRLTRPKFLPIIASNSLATMLAKKANGRVDGFVVEGPTAGGHNAPPRGEKRLNEQGEPVYGERDSVDLKKLSKLGLPFWVAGGAGRPGTIDEAQEEGGVGIQVGTLFAYCRESGLLEGLKRSVLEMDLGYLRVPFRKTDGNLGYRCPAEPVRTYLAKGGAEEETEGRKCLCNALLANVGHAQARGQGVEEAPLLTSGDDLSILSEFLQGRDSYSARDVIDYLLS